MEQEHKDRIRVQVGVQATSFELLDKIHEYIKKDGIGKVVMITASYNRNNTAGPGAILATGKPSRIPRRPGSIGTGGSATASPAPASSSPPREIGTPDGSSSSAVTGITPAARPPTCSFTPHAARQGRRTRLPRASRRRWWRLGLRP